MHIRRLYPADAALYQAFRLRGLREHPQAFTSSHDEVSRQPLALVEKRLAADSEKVWGVFVHGVLAGMVGLNHESRLHNRHKATLVGMHVADEFSGQGLGRALVDTAVQQARLSGVELLVLTVTDSNRRACALYERAGFVTYGIEPDAMRVGGRSFGKRHMFLPLAPASLAADPAAQG